jgi:hypothetical protein
MYVCMYIYIILYAYDYKLLLSVTFIQSVHFILLHKLYIR